MAIYLGSVLGLPFKIGFYRLLTLICPSFLNKELPSHLEASTGSKQAGKKNERSLFRTNISDRNTSEMSSLVPGYC